MSGRYERSGSFTENSDGRDNRFSAKESDHIKVRSTGSSNRPSPYERSDRNTDRSSREQGSERDGNNYGRSSEKDSTRGPSSGAGAARRPYGKERSDEKKRENLYDVPIQKYPTFEGKAESPKAASKPPKKKLSVASVFNCDSSEEEEEIPLQAKMRMRNVGKNTPTSAGPNSFGKTKRGFTDTVKMWDKDPVKVAQFIVEKQKEGEDQKKRFDD